jgi:hypothetical protein
MKTRHVLPILLLTLAVLSVNPARTQTNEPNPCRIGYQASPIGFWTWAPGSEVKVYIRAADFNREQLPELFVALKNWNEVSQQTGSGVKFEYQGDTNVVLSCANCLTIMRGPVFDKTQRHVTELKAYSAQRNQIISYATITVDPVLTNPKALLSAMAHELGHNLGLLDCYSCKRKSTVMNQLKSVNATNGMEGPSRCDIAQVSQAYKELKIRVRPSPHSRDLIDEGEEPEDDDTPIVVPKPADKPPQY